MKRILILATVAVLAVGVIGTASAHDDQSERKDAKAKLSGFAETPSVSTTGTGTLRLSLDATKTTITWELTFSGLQGGAVTGAHLHLGQPGVAGGIIANLCPGACVSPASGTINVASIIPAPTQGIVAGDWAEVLRAIRAGAVYVNVHTGVFPNGEIRGQLGGGKGWN